jgi:transcriptional regulator with XRE-family HTH domain
MANYRVGDVIRLTRKAAGITQEQLSDGICSVETLSRIENGKHAVKRETYSQLMAKMGRDTSRCYALCMSKDMELLEERIWLEDALSKFDYREADRYLSILKRKIADTPMNQQYIARIEGLLDYRNKRIDAEEWIKREENAIRITVPEYEKYLFIEKKEDAFPFTELEILTLMSLANAYSVNEQPDIAIRIYDALLLGLEEEYMDFISVRKLRMVINFNYIRSLEQQDKYQEALDKGKKLLENAIKFDYGRMIPMALVAIVWDMNKIIEKDNNANEILEIKRKLRQAYYIAAARNDNYNVNIIKNYYRSCYGEEV